MGFAARQAAISRMTAARTALRVAMDAAGGLRKEQNEMGKFVLGFILIVFSIAVAIFVVALICLFIKTIKTLFEYK